MMNTNILYKGITLIRKRALLLVAGSFLLISCGTQMGGYTETDGVYYDPNKDTLPEGVILNDSGNQVDEYYDYQENSVIENSEIISEAQKNKYQDWNNVSNDSDWGSFAGNETNYYGNSYYGWNSAWGYGYRPFFGSGYGYGYGYGYGLGYFYPYSSWGISFYSPYYSYYPFYGYNSFYYGYSPYYDVYNPFLYGFGNGYFNRYQRSGANGRLYNSYGRTKQEAFINRNYNGFRSNNINTNSYRNSGNNSNVQTNTNPRYRNTQPVDAETRTTSPRYRNTQPVDTGTPATSPRYRSTQPVDNGTRTTSPRYRAPQVQPTNTQPTRQNNYRNDTRSQPTQSAPVRSNTRSSDSGSRSSGSSNSGGSRSGGGFRR